QTVFRQGEDDSDRLQLRDDQQWIGVGGVHHVACIHQPQSDAAADRRGDVRVEQIQLRVVDCCLVGAGRSFQLVGGGLLGIYLLLRHRTRLIQQTLEALVIQLCV